MKILWLCFILHTTFAHFGTPYLKHSRLCQSWSCINTNLGLSDSLPPKDQFTNTLKSLLPAGAWQDTVEPVLNICYRDRPRMYMNTCPSQALLHCVVDQLIQACPEESLRENDACAPLTSIAGLKYMFSQSLYADLEKNLPTERRPSWFLKNYFNSKCCRLPELFNSTVLSECGFSSMLHHTVYPIQMPHLTPPHIAKNAETPTSALNTLNTVDLSKVQIFDEHNAETFNAVELPKVESDDPLDCCGMSGFIEPSWRSECGFSLQWDSQNRLTIKDTEVPTTPPPTTTPKPVSHNVKIVPVSCEKETCVFKSLGIVSETGKVDTDAFSRLLDNMTSTHTAWRKAKARVVTKCLNKPITEYDSECEINKVLACTFDVLTENCPYAKKTDPCKHSSLLRSKIMCQISSSKYRPKNRRQFCGVPSFVNHPVLSECGVKSLYETEYVPDIIVNKAKSWTASKYSCKEMNEPTKCLLKKMGVLNKYNFMDYFKMKEKIRGFVERSGTAALEEVYLSAFTNTPLYREHCSSSKKLLNILDSMLMTCPLSQRGVSLKCDKLFADLTNTPPFKNTTERLGELLKHYQRIYLPQEASTPNTNAQATDNIAKPQIPTFTPKSNLIRLHRVPLYNGIVSSQNVPKVTANGTPVVHRQVQVLVPVYLRLRPNDGIWRGGPLPMSPLSVQPISNLQRPLITP